MKMLFSSSDITQFESIAHCMTLAGIRFEVRHHTVARTTGGMATYPEFWVEDEDDYRTAALLLASQRRSELDATSLTA